MSTMTPVEILLVEDTPTDAELTMRALKRSNLTNRVTWVKDGAEALDYLFFTGDYAEREKMHPRLVLLDLKLPKVDGIAVARRIKSESSTRHIPVVVLTSSAQDRDIVETYGLGVNSYLVKPVNSRDFLDIVAQAGLYWAVLNKIPGDQ